MEIDDLFEIINEENSLKNQMDIEEKPIKKATLILILSDESDDNTSQGSPRRNEYCESVEQIVQ